jgi:hypothetical protein
MWTELPFDTLKGMTLTSVTNNDDEIVFLTADGRKFRLFHEQDCSEYVRVEDITGELEFLVGSPILMAEEVSNSTDECEGCSDSFTWTYYKLATIKGYVTIRWLGESNGYYSESVSFEEIKELN